MEEEKVLGPDGSIPAGRNEMLVAYNLTLQWLESCPKSWPTNEAGLLKRIQQYCHVVVDISPEAVIKSMETLAVLEVEKSKETHEDALSASKVKEKLKVKVLFDKFQDGEELLGHESSTAIASIVRRILALLEASRDSPPRTVAQLEDLVAHHCQVEFKVRPREVLDELMMNDMLEIDDKSDQVLYDGEKIIHWRDPPINKGFGIGSFLLVIVIILCLTPNALKTLGVY